MSAPLVKLEKLTTILSGFAFKSANFSETEGLPLARIRDVVRGRSETFYKGDYSDDFVINDGDMLIGMDGDFNREKWQGGKALLNQRVCKITADGDPIRSAVSVSFSSRCFAPNSCRDACRYGKTSFREENSRD
ncbi:hypothetical protein [Shewanella sp. BJSY2023SW005]|uniref:hypothetical protein n=1 Tax=Shewanella sp. BJSY2023SW005 TaxID=3392043 RepID=UPI0039B43B15